MTSTAASQTATLRRANRPSPACMHARTPPEQQPNCADVHRTNGLCSSGKRFLCVQRRGLLARDWSRQRCHPTTTPGC